MAEWRALDSAHRFPYTPDHQMDDVYGNAWDLESALVDQKPGVQ
jgi:hypothetical protein